MGKQVLTDGEGAILREFKCRGDGGLDLRVDAGTPGRFELFANDPDLVPLLPGPQFFAAAITRLVVLGGSPMLAPAAQLTLPARSAAFARSHRSNPICRPLTGPPHVALLQLS